MKDLNKAKSLLKQGNFTCVILKEEKLYTSDLRGVKPLLEFYKNGTDINGFSAADKVVGKATAFLYVLLGIKEIFALVISRPALEVLRNNEIYIEYETLTDNIINRKGDGICPFEMAVMEITSHTEALKAICDKAESFK